ncbi:glycosyltransferase family 4 protein [Sphingomonas profundi]|uniref:glycosyltransferase family 4 protein n=1 Tax=Alterirhizorhabdus profundi TaxID=2681549 RepID=UPI0012E941D5|nr:glycosyltransferase family 4 protein [Sphingomonas profundi]
MSRRRLLLTADTVGGVWQYATELARALAPLDYDVVLALLGPAPSEGQRGAVADIELVETGLPLDWLAPDAGAVAAAGAALARLAADCGADIVQVNQPALAADTRFGVPVVAMAHSCVATWWQAVRGDAPEPADFAWQSALMQRGLAAADAIVAPSHAYAAALHRRYALPALPDVVHNGRTPLAAPAGALHDFAYTAGRLWDEGKDVATLDRAAARLGIPFKAAGPTVGPNGQQIRLDHLHALGRVEERVIAGCISARPVFVSAARYEPFGLAVLEAALAGCPLVLSDIPTFRELWDGAALFVEPGDHAGFARAIETLVGDVPVRLARGDLARRHAAHFSPARMAAAMDGVYARLLARSAKRGVAA